LDKRPTPQIDEISDGFMICGREKQNREWTEPFFASLVVAEKGGHLESYRITCGDADRPLASTSFEADRLFSIGTPGDWLLTFVKMAN
jgi:hypothetical protein